MRRLLKAVLIAACAAAVASRGGAAPERAVPVLVTPAWLAERLDEPGLVVLHVASLRDDYTRGHIPGARFLWQTGMTASTPELGFEMTSVDSLAAVLRSAGVSNDSRIVLCNVLGDVAGTARVFVTLEYLGIGDRTAILDGGLAAWKAAGLPVSEEEARFERGDFEPRPRVETIVRLDRMRELYRSPDVQVLDARSKQEFNAPDGPNVVRGGHLPGARNVPAAALFDSLDCYQPADSLAAAFASAGVRPGGAVIAYCGVGRSACPLYVAAKLLGYEPRLYDGSFQEWSRKVDLPVERADKK